MSNPPNLSSLALEEDLLGSMLLAPSACEAAMAMVTASDFTSPANGNIYESIVSLYGRGQPLEPDLVVEEWTRRAGPDSAEVDGSRLVAAMSNCGNPAAVNSYIIELVRLSDARRAIGMLMEAADALRNRANPYDVVEKLQGTLEEVGSAILDLSKQEAETISQVMADISASGPWLLDGLIRRDWRVLLVASEGIGKSTLVRQIAMLSAQGLHPLTLKPLPEPIRTLVVDLENPAAAIAETGGRMHERLKERFGADYDETRCRFFRRPGGLNLRTRQARSDLEREVALHQPDLVVIGPIYKLLERQSAGRSGTESHEEATEPVLRILDDLRTRYRFALLMEHHAPQGKGGGDRELRPYGSQRWLAWPEIGISMRKSTKGDHLYRLERFRGDRMQSNWPDELSRGDIWPWMGTWRSGEF